MSNSIYDMYKLVQLEGWNHNVRLCRMSNPVKKLWLRKYACMRAFHLVVCVSVCLLACLFVLAIPFFLLMQLDV